MTTREMTVEEHIQTALTFLEQSDQEFGIGDILQGSEKLWGAVAHATIAIGKLRGRPTGSHRNMGRTADLLSQERSDKSFAAQFALAGVFHRSFYGHDYFDPFHEINPLDRDRGLVADYVRRVIEIAQEHQEMESST